MCYGDPDHGKDGHYRRWLESREFEQQQGELYPDGLPPETIRGDSMRETMPFSDRNE